MRVAKRFYVLDYDRCLGNTEQLYRLLQTSVAAVMGDFDTSAMDESRRAADSRGSVFDELEYIKHHAGSPACYQQILRTFIARGQSIGATTLLEEGAVDFIEYLVQRYPFGILTYGRPAWQEAKLEASSLHVVPHIIVDHKYKIRSIRAWRDAQTGLFVLPAEFSDATGYSHAEEVILIDDKATAFADIEKGMRGYWLLHREPLTSQLGEVDALVSKVTSFQQVMDREG